MKITKQEALTKIEELKKFIEEEEKVVGIAIKSRSTGDVIFQSTKTTYKEAIKEKGNADLINADLYDSNLRYADLSNANLSNADLRYADLSDAHLINANLSNADLSGADFYGKGAGLELTKKQVPDFLLALGFTVKN